jgi:hypothetical protein
MDSIKAGPGLRITYSSTLVNISADDPRIPDLKKNFYPHLLQGLKSNVDLNIYKQAGVIFSYAYYDRNGVFLIKYDFGSSDYR